MAIACYRDPECQHTIRDLFEKAARPDRVFVGVVWQCDREKDADCFAVKTRPGQVHEEIVHPSEARGPCWARCRCEKFWQGEEYVMQIDSHMRFCPAWDQGALEMLDECPSDRPILTTYPPPYWLPNRTRKGTGVIYVHRNTSNGTAQLRVRQAFQSDLFAWFE